jgi:hypothetical protein
LRFEASKTLCYDFWVLMVTPAARPMLRWAAKTLSPCDGAIARLSPLSCGLRGR